MKKLGSYGILKEDNSNIITRLCGVDLSCVPKNMQGLVSVRKQQVEERGKDIPHTENSISLLCLWTRSQVFIRYSGESGNVKSNKQFTAC